MAKVGLYVKGIAGTSQGKRICEFCRTETAQIQVG